MSIDYFSDGTPREPGSLGSPFQAAEACCDVSDDQPTGITALFIDLDGVLCDFMSAAFRVFDREYVPAEWPEGETDLATVLDVPEKLLWAAIDLDGPRFWAELADLPWTLDLCDLCDEVAPGNWFVATLPQDSDDCYAGKALWLLGADISPSRNAFLGARKDLLAGPGRFLIDDNEQNCHDWEAAGGTAILFPQPWNSLRPVALAGNSFDYVRLSLQHLANPHAATGEVLPDVQ